jgi:hypothetical protein
MTVSDDIVGYQSPGTVTRSRHRIRSPALPCPSICYLPVALCIVPPMTLGEAPNELDMDAGCSSTLCRSDFEDALRGAQCRHLLLQLHVVFLTVTAPL